MIVVSGDNIYILSGILWLDNRTFFSFSHEEDTEFDKEAFFESDDNISDIKECIK